MDIPQIDVLGIKVAAIDLEIAVNVIAEWLNSGDTSRYVCVTDVHCIMQGSRRRDVRDAYKNAAICVPDGMPLTWVGRLRGYRTMNRVYGPDLMLSLLSKSATSGFTNFFLGGAEGVADDLAAKMTERFPGLEVVGTYCPPWRPLTDLEKRDLITMISDLKPDLVWVGLGAPKQDLFMAEFNGQFDTKVMIGVGAAFDFHTGRVRQAPRWMMRSGLEWFFRLCVEPRRLGPRYLRNNPAFLWHIFLQQTGLRKYPVD